MIVYHTSKVGRRVVGTNAPPRACVCEMESECVFVWGRERETDGVLVCVCVRVCVCRWVLCGGCNLSVHGFIIER